MKDKINLTTDRIPEHLPKRLAMASWGWDWLTACSPGEGFFDLEKAFKELVERGYNSVRLESYINWAFNENGKPRGTVKIGNVAEPGFCTNLPFYTTRGGEAVNALEKVLELFHLADKYGIFIALTTWEFHGGLVTCFAQADIIEEVWSTPKPLRFMKAAKQYDLLICELKRHGLENRIAYIEIHNEMDGIGVGNIADVKKIAEEAINFLQQRHPDILFCGDYAPVPKGLYSANGNVMAQGRYADYSFDYEHVCEYARHFPENNGLLDHHLYGWGVMNELYKRAGISLVEPKQGLDNYMEELERENEFFNWLLKDEKISWRKYSKHLTTPTIFRQFMYFYEYLNPDRFDYWLYKNFNKYEEEMYNYWKNSIQYFADYARKRNIPVTCDEGYLFILPINSCFEVSAVGKSMHEFIVRNMIEQGYWGIMISTYTWPGLPFWDKEAEWLKKLNSEILEGV